MLLKKRWKNVLTKCNGMVVDIFHNDTLQRMRFYHSPFLTKEKVRLICWHFLAFSNRREKAFQFWHSAFAETKIQLNLVFPRCTWNHCWQYTLHHLQSSWSSPMYIPQGMTALHNQGCLQGTWWMVCFRTETVVIKYPKQMAEVHPWWQWALPSAPPLKRTN